MKVSNRQISTWSKMGSRAAYGLGLLDLAKQEPNLLVVTPDTSTSAGLIGFGKVTNPILRSGHCRAKWRRYCGGPCK